MTEVATKVRIETIRVVGRHRYTLGDVGSLADSIADVGMLNPITLTTNSRLVAGQRRLEASRILGWSTVPARFVESLDDAAAMLRAERDENLCRKEMLPSELASLGEALLTIEAEQAKQRQLSGKRPSSFEGGRSDGRDRANEAAARVADALGMGRTNYYYLRGVYRAATDMEADDSERALARSVLDRIDKGAALQPTVLEFRRQQRARQEARDVKDTAVAEPVPVADEGEDWVPATNDRSPGAVARRRALIRRLAGEAYSSHQIAQRLSMQPESVRRIARAEGITIGADAAMGRTRQNVDSNRIVRETVHMLEGLGPGLGLIDFDALDQAEVGAWAASLTDSIRTLNRLNKRLKEKTQ